MIHFYLVILCVFIAAAGSLLFGTLTYSLREFSRVKFEALLERKHQTAWLERTLSRSEDLAFVTAVVRLFSNILLLIGTLRLLAHTDLAPAVQYFIAVLSTGFVSVLLSVAIPHAISRHAPEIVIAWSLPLLHGLRALLSPLVHLMHWLDRIVGILVDDNQEAEEVVEQEILSAVEEGEEQGIVDPQEREMIESVIEFRDTTAGQIMTSRPEIVAIESTASLSEVKSTLEESGHSRLPVYTADLDHIVGILYARDLLKHLGRPPEKFEIRSALRPPIYVPESKPLRDLLREFRLQKVHIAIVLDEYGGTAGLVTIEDVIEELVGEIQDEHEQLEPAMFRRIDEQTFEADARMEIPEINRLTGINLPEDADFQTLGGFVSTTVGHIPEKGAEFEHAGVRYTVLDAEPQKVNRIRAHMLLQIEPKS
jgi:CBS domain containing-hemolysin-like protein